jgi:hypothetical protein
MGDPSSLHVLTPLRLKHSPKDFCLSKSLLVSANLDGSPMTWNVFRPWIFESQGGVRAVIDVAMVIAIGQSRPDFSEIGLSDWLTAQHTKSLWAGCPVIH